MNNDHFLISQVAERLGVPLHRISYLYLTKKIPEPRLRLGHRRIISTAEAEVIAKTLGRSWKHTEDNV